MKKLIPISCNLWKNLNNYKLIYLILETKEIETINFYRLIFLIRLKVL